MGCFFLWLWLVRFAQVSLCWFSSFFSSTRFQKSRRSFGGLHLFCRLFQEARSYPLARAVSRGIRIRPVATCIAQIGRKARVKRPAATACYCKRKEKRCHGAHSAASWWLFPSSRLPSMAACDALSTPTVGCPANLGRGMQVISSRTRPLTVSSTRTYCQSTILHPANLLTLQYELSKVSEGCPAVPAALWRNEWRMVWWRCGREPRTVII